MSTENENKTDINVTRDRSGVGSLSTATHSMLRGISVIGKGNAAPINQDHQGFTFITRPAINLTSDNIRPIRRLQFMLKEGQDNNAHLGNAIRTLLDPQRKLAYGLKSDSKDKTNSQYRFEKSPLVDDNSPFLSILSNNLISLTGWPDEVVEYFEYGQGLAKQVNGHIDTRPENYGAYDLTATFDNVEGDIITSLIGVMREYATRVKVGDMVPYPYYMYNRVVDYNTRIYRLVTNPTKTKLKKIACCGAAMFGSVPTGAAFNYDNQNTYAADNATTTTTFRCFGVRYNDPIIVRDFNDTVAMFNPAMRGLPELDNNELIRSGGMVRVPNRHIALFDTRMYPRINTKTYDIEWWIAAEIYDRVMAASNEHLIKFTSEVE